MDIPKPKKPIDEMTGTEKRPYVKQLVDFFRPEAREITREALTSKSLTAQTTKDGYGYVLSLLSRFDPAMRCVLLTAMVLEGYPADTARSLASMLGV